MSAQGAHPTADTLRRSRSAGDFPLRSEGVRSSHSRRLPADDSDVRLVLRSEHTALPRTAQQMPPTSAAPTRSPRLPTAATTTGSSGTGTTAQRPVSRYHRFKMFIGIGNDAPRERRSLVSLTLTLASSTTQIITITIILSLSGTRFRSPTQPGLSEWVACSRPLGPWLCIWVFRAVLASGLNYWGYLREIETYRRRSARERPGSQNHGQSGSPVIRLTAETRNPPHTSTRQNHDIEAQSNSPPLPNALLFSRLTFFSSLLTLSWFLTAHILEYTSINTCRHSSPHIWWLTFGILCLMYLMVLEVIILGVVVLIVAPVLILFWNIALLCFGRHPLQTGNTIKPDIGKLSKELVDRIPLVMYIPPPPDHISPSQEEAEDRADEPIHQFPPESSSPAKSRFGFVKRLSSFYSTKQSGGNGEDIEKPLSWEEHWEKVEYPFVTLEKNRAVCAICLADFTEPKRIKGLQETTASSPSSGSDSQLDAGTESLPNVAKPDRRSETQAKSKKKSDTLKLTDPGDGAQPLRLLECGHVFHKGCLDPWLTDVSGRCPVCQRAVEMKGDKGSRRGRYSIEATQGQTRDSP